MNSVVISGNNVRDIELRFLQSGKALANFSVAVSQGKNKDDEWESAFFDCQAWGQLAENIAESVTKGSKVIVVGKLITDSWKDKETGENRYKVKINAFQVGVDLSFARAVVMKNEKPSPEQIGEDAEFTDEDIPF
jgi:single-strand DNA-binding protein